VNWNVGRSRALSFLICFLLSVEFGIAGQNDAALKIVVTRGSGGQNVISQPAGPVSVRVTDPNDRPVAGATVVFTTPASGPSGDFVNGSNSVIVFTDAQGLAVVPQYRANSAVGAYQIQVRAAYMSRAATTSIPQTNIAQQKSSRKMIMIAALAGGVAAAAFAAKGGGGGGEQSPSTPPVVTPPTVSTPPTIVFGGSSVGGPR
jgi:hypothetical protein